MIHKLPQAGSTKNPQLISITAQFSEQVRGFTANTFALVNRANQSHVQGIISYDPTTRTARFNAPYGLDLNVQYLVVIEPGITDLAGNPLSRSSWTFTTGE